MEDITKEAEQILEEAEAVAFYRQLDRDKFAAYVLQEVGIVNLDGEDYKISDFLSEEQIKEIWDNASGIIGAWAQLSKARLNSYTLVFASGVILGILVFPKLHKEAND